MKTIKFYAHTSDSFSGSILEDGKPVLIFDGYPPTFMGDGDGVELEIDIKTGQILNWTGDAEQLESWLSDTSTWTPEEIAAAKARRQASKA